MKLPDPATYFAWEISNCADRSTRHNHHDPSWNYSSGDRREHRQRASALGRDVDVAACHLGPTGYRPLVVVPKCHSEESRPNLPTNKQYGFSCPEQVSNSRHARRVIRTGSRLTDAIWRPLCTREPRLFETPAACTVSRPCRRGGCQDHVRRCSPRMLNVALLLHRCSPAVVKPGGHGDAQGRDRDRACL